MRYIYKAKDVTQRALIIRTLDDKYNNISPILFNGLDEESDYRTYPYIILDVDEVYGSVTFTYISLRGSTQSLDGIILNEEQMFNLLKDTSIEIKEDRKMIYDGTGIKFKFT